LELARPPVILLVHQSARIGYIEGSNVTYEIRGADGDINRLPQLTRELTATSPDVIIGSTSPAAVVLAAATVDIPIVMTVVGDPIALGLSNSISRPSRNATGFTNSSVSLAAKRLELLREFVPGRDRQRAPVLTQIHCSSERQNCGRQTGLDSFAMVPGPGPAFNSNAPAATGGGSLGYNKMLRNY
jgi:ABC transporter substrate binding protein